MDKAQKESASYDWKDISDEEHRDYVYLTKFGAVARYRVPSPDKLNVKRGPLGDSHRIIQKTGPMVYVPPGWIAIEWGGHYSF